MIESNPFSESTNLYQSIYHTRAGQRIQENTQLLGGSFTPRAGSFSKQYQSQINANKGKSPNFDSKNTNPSHSLKQSDLLIRMNSHDKSLSNSALYRYNPQKSSSIPRPSSNSSTQSKQIKYENPSILSTYGRNSMMEPQGQPSQVTNGNFKGLRNQKADLSASMFPTPKYDHLNRFNIYQKQQKPYNIVDNQPRRVSEALKVYPKLSLEDKLIETGRYQPKY